MKLYSNKHKLIEFEDLFQQQQTQVQSTKYIA